MPNYVTNILKLSGSKKDIEKLKNVVANKDRNTPFDFDRIIPMPESLNIEENSDTERCLDLFSKFLVPFIKSRGMTEVNDENLLKIQQDSAEYRKEKNIPEKEWATGQTAALNRLKYGHATWYTWRIHFWGTKWNAFDCEPFRRNTFRFTTAWRCPLPVVLKLSEMFPEITFDFSWADEDIGSNCGKAIVKNGEIVEDKTFKDGGQEALLFALRVHDLSPKDAGYFKNWKGEYFYLFNKEYYIIKICGQDALFTNEHLNEDRIPNVLYPYEVRKDEADIPRAVEKKVKTNFGGTVLTYKPLDFGDKDSLEFTKEFNLNFLGKKCDIREFIKMFGLQSS